MDGIYHTLRLYCHKKIDLLPSRAARRLPDNAYELCICI